MTLVHFTSRQMAERILVEGLRTSPVYSPYVWAGEARDTRRRPPAELTPSRRCIFAYPLVQDDQARCNCWADVCDDKPETRDRRPGGNTAVVFSLKDDDTVWVGAWGWPWEGYPEVDAAYVQSGMVYKQQRSFSAFHRDATEAVASVRRGTNGRLTSIYDLLWGLVKPRAGDSVDIEQLFSAFLASQEPAAAANVKAQIAESLARAEKDTDAIAARKARNEQDQPSLGSPPAETTCRAGAEDKGTSEEAEDRQEYLMESKPMWASTGFEICVVRDILPEEIHGIADLEQLDPPDSAWYREGMFEETCPAVRSGSPRDA